MNKHTPGPWHLRMSGNATPIIEHGDCHLNEVGSLDHRICAMPAGITRDYNSLENARLIAAAPDLLAALQEVVRVFESNPASISDTVWVTGNRPETLYDHCRAAIAKATGEQP